MGDVSLNMLDTSDLGKAVHYIFGHSDECLHKTYPLVGDKRTIKEMADIMTRELRPYAVEDAGVSYDGVRRGRHRQNPCPHLLGVLMSLKGELHLKTNRVCFVTISICDVLQQKVP